ncbi:hypothetical protein DM860_015713 [Cuscuta australis]|uniref:Uncharacterized protein n=1 Tax=Cuscuta australis TaxID=267555 RepID=A0A328DR97_9ASTE|nr:hypothetical protein DM860_015713 [Cuscuta australis]
MEWKKGYLDVILVPIGCLICIGYHVWLWHKVRTQPLTTIIGTNAVGRRLWVSAIMKSNFFHAPFGTQNSNYGIGIEDFNSNSSVW